MACLDVVAHLHVHVSRLTCEKVHVLLGINVNYRPRVPDVHAIHCLHYRPLAPKMRAGDVLHTGATFQHYSTVCNSAVLALINRARTGLQLTWSPIFQY